MLNFTHSSRNANYSGAIEAILNRRRAEKQDGARGRAPLAAGGREAEPVGPHARHLAGALPAPTLPDRRAEPCPPREAICQAAESGTSRRWQRPRRPPAGEGRGGRRRSARGSSRPRPLTREGDAVCPASQRGRPRASAGTTRRDPIPGADPEPGSPGAPSRPDRVGGSPAWGPTRTNERPAAPGSRIKGGARGADGRSPLHGRAAGAAGSRGCGNGLGSGDTGLAGGAPRGSVCFLPRWGPRCL